jgi:hypothetical protein
MTQQERLKKLFEENARNVIVKVESNPSAIFGVASDYKAMDCDTFIRVTSELLEERWIRVKERKPDKSEYVLCINDERQSVCTFDSAPNKSEPKFYLNDRDYWSEHEGVTHWMPLPQPPNF